MDFFSQQDKARRNTTGLVLLFLLAVFCLVMLTNVLIGVTLWFMTQEETMQRGVSVIAQTDTSTVAKLFSWKTFGLISLGVGGAILCAIGYKWLQLRSGGKAVAESLGGQRIYPNTEDPDQKQVLNVVEEMALASGMPVPAVYLLKHELGINAFAAGNKPSDAVIGVTQGCIEHFKRDELQGVIAHEFSHILNGDMRLNLRLIALLHGIVFIGLVGEMMLRSSSHQRSGGRVALLGGALVVIGWLGSLFGNLIKSAVSRQREYLADASAVQFTRNPEGIANALKLIGGYSHGSEITNPRSSEIRHLFFGQAISQLSNMFATHPPLVDRILRVDPHWDGNYLYRGGETRQRKLAEEQERKQAEKEEKKRQFEHVVMTTAAASVGLDPEKVFNSEQPLDSIRDEIDGIPSPLHEQAHDPLGAVVLCFALLLHDDETLQAQQLQIIDQSDLPGARELSLKLFSSLQQMHKSYRLALIELLLPALKCMSEQQYKSFKRNLMQLIRVDKQTDLFEWCLFQLIRHYLAGEHEPDWKRNAKYNSLEQVAEEYRLVLSLLAHSGHDNNSDTEKAFYRGANSAGLYNIQLLDEQDCDLEQFIKAVNHLADSYPALKPRLLSGFKNCVMLDGEIRAMERELLTCIAAIMDSPVPLLED